MPERIESVSRAGLTFDIRDEGPRDGEPVVLLHGFPQDSRSWGLGAPLLHARGYRTFAPDQRGYSPGLPHQRACRRTRCDDLVDGALHRRDVFGILAHGLPAENLPDNRDVVRRLGDVRHRSGHQRGCPMRRRMRASCLVPGSARTPAGMRAQARSSEDVAASLGHRLRRSWRRTASTSQHFRPSTRCCARAEEVR